MLKKSYYTETFHIAQKFYHFNLVTGALVLTDNDLTLTKSNIPPEEIESLTNSGILTKLKVQEEISLVQFLVKKLIDYKKFSYDITVVPTLDCNLNCSYCYQKKIDKKQLLSDQEIETITSYIKQNKIKNIHFYGGEPLQSSTIPCIKKIVLACKNKNVTMEATTNGVDLILFKDLLGEDGINKLQITLDGNKDFHDSRRKKIDGSGTFMQIKESIKFAVKKGVTVIIRMNVDHKNLSSCWDTKNEILQEFSENKNIQVYAHPTFNIHNKVTSFRDDNVSDGNFIIQPHMYILQKSIEKNLPLNISIGHCCTYSSNGYKIFAPGGLWNCWGTVGDEEKKVCSYSALKINSGAIPKKHYAVYRPLCSNCKYLTVCAGGCYKNYLESPNNYCPQKNQLSFSKII